MAMYTNGVDNDNVYKTGLLMYCHISLNRPTVVATGPHNMGYVLILYADIYMTTLCF